MEDQQKSEIEKLNATLEQLKEESNEQKKKHEKTLEQQQKDYEGKMAEMRKKFEEDKASINKEIFEIERTKKQQIANLETEIREWEIKYQHREARPEDLERIRKLEALIKERTEAIEKVQQELKHYQTELLNRETTYNKVFNNRPQMGVLSALERKAKRDAMIASISTSPTLPPLPNSRNTSPRKDGHV